MKRITLAAVAFALAMGGAASLPAAADTPDPAADPSSVSVTPPAPPTVTAEPAPAPTESAPVPPVTKARDGATRFRLVSTADSTIRCSSMHGTDLVQIDYVFREHATGVRGWRTVYVSTDGVRFLLVRATQNPPWGCVPQPSMFREPAEWSND